MHFHIVDPDRSLTESCRVLAERRLVFALSRFESRISRATLTVRDENGPKGGLDKRCQLLVKLRGVDEVILTNTDATFESCVSRLADRAGWTIGRQLDRRNDMRRRSVGYAGANDVA